MIYDSFHGEVTMESQLCGGDTMQALQQAIRTGKRLEARP